MINLPTPPQFRGLDPYLPVTMYQRQLPHWRQFGATYFVTFRLADALPQEKLDKAGVRHFGNSEMAGLRFANSDRYPPANSEFPKCLTPDHADHANRRLRHRPAP